MNNIDRAKAILTEGAVPELVDWVKLTEERKSGEWAQDPMVDNAVAFQIVDEPDQPIALVVYLADQDFEVCDWAVEAAGA